MKWYRMYSEARNDAKLRALNDSQHRVWFNLLCIAGEQSDRGTITGYDDELLAVEVSNGDVELLTETLNKLQKLRMIRRDEDRISFINWEKRQYDNPSDRPKAVNERVKKHRAKTKRNDCDQPNTKSETTCNVDVTSCNDKVTEGNTLYTDTDSDTDTEADIELLPPLPSKGERHEPVVVVVGGRDLHVYKSAIDQYKHYFVYEPNRTITELLHSYLDDGVQMDMLAWAMRRAAEKGKAWDYAKGAIEKLFAKGVRTAEQAEQENQAFHQQQEQKQSRKVVPLREDKLPASVQWQLEQQSVQQPMGPEEPKTIEDYPELKAMLEQLRQKQKQAR
ncbi:DnaD domain protein [Brevibacillus borstelensis]|uniref:DnaD domain protein n=1 Tax=Brevibacillus borstelensis TaxID=45462 RepID=UPI0030C62851